MENCVVCGSSDLKHFMSKENHEFYKCKSCKLEFIDPKPDSTSLMKIYNSEYYERWEQKKYSEAYIEQKKKTFKYRLNHLPFTIPIQSKILDCGCATGIFLEIVKDLECDPYGIDISTYAADCCVQKFGNEHVFLGNLENAVFRIGDINFFDLIFMSDYIEHVENPKTVIEKAYSLLKPDGKLIIYTPNTNSLLKKVLGSKWPHYKMEHLFYFSPQNLMSLLKENKFVKPHNYRNVKYVSLNFISEYFKVFHNPVFNFFFRCLVLILPERLKQRTFKIAVNEMTIICYKPK
jgi:2-polyprenyl-3-methyl-5-hydroxy-6-metoxy-1,4-benzoquinol methylase